MFRNGFFTRKFYNISFFRVSTQVVDRKPKLTLKIRKSQEPTQSTSRTESRIVSNEKYPNAHNMPNVVQKSLPPSQNEPTLDKIRLRIKMRKQEKVPKNSTQHTLPQSNNTYLEPRTATAVEPPVKKPRLQSKSQRSKAIVIEDDEFVSQPVNELQYIQTINNHDYSLST